VERTVIFIRMGYMIEDQEVVTENNGITGVSRGLSCYDLKFLHHAEWKGDAGSIPYPFV
jgi:hypothetical protein